jgi:hypothetical protein
MSTKTGWSLAIVHPDRYELLEYGQIPKIEKPEAEYPSDYVLWAHDCATQIIAIVEKHTPDRLIIEETAGGSKNNFSQKILEFIHYLIGKYIMDKKIPVTYYKTGEWRTYVEAKMTLAEAKKNKLVRADKAKTGQKLARDENGKIMGKITKKHVNVRTANEIFGLSLKIGQNDTADALLLGYAYYKQKCRT